MIYLLMSLHLCMVKNYFPYPFQGSFMPEYNRKTNASVTAIMDHMESSARTAVIEYAEGTLPRYVEELGQMQCGQSNLKV